MKPYLVFYGENYRPNGGWGDFHGDFDTLDEAKASLDQDRNYDWCDIIYEKQTVHRIVDGEVIL